MCLGHSAHDVRSSHEIFNSPLKVTIEYTDYPTPKNYLHYHYGKDLGDTIKVWKVQTADGKEDEELGWGVVAQGNDFEDSPDAEVMAGGLNSKGPNAVALGRHGNLFHWGWVAAPGQMTDELKKTFINTVHYIKKFERQQPFVRRVANNRISLLDYCLLLDALPEIYKEYNPDDPAKAQEEMEKYRQMHLKRTFSDELIAKFGIDGMKYYNYFLENLEYVRIDSLHYSRFYIDEDAKAWGISNRSIELLDKAISVLEEKTRERNDEHNRAARILLRYTNKQFAWPQQWRAWFDENKDKLFFTDAGGYKFMVSP